MHTCSANAWSTHSWHFCPCFRAVSLNMTRRVACRWVSTEASISPMLASVSSAALRADARPSSASCARRAALSPSLSPFQQQNRGPALYPQYVSVDPCGFAFNMQVLSIREGAACEDTACGASWPTSYALPWPYPGGRQNMW